jgi:hypothetical protein
VALDDVAALVSAIDGYCACFNLVLRKLLLDRWQKTISSWYQVNFGTNEPKGQ